VLPKLSQELLAQMVGTTRSRVNFFMNKYGHPTGNRALCRLAATLRQSCRSIDTAARCGGDEFGVVLLETTVVSAARTANRVREHLAGDGELPRLSVSVGLATYPQHGPTVDALLGAADRALYEMKLMSRDASMALVPPSVSEVSLRSDPPTLPRRIHPTHRPRIRRTGPAAPVEDERPSG
jgi:predicted signal transduction protein with EAL and GGDEF domain